MRFAAGADRVVTCDGQALAQRFLGDTIAANVLLMGFAWQRGLVPVSLAALDRAIELNGVAVAPIAWRSPWALAAGAAQAIEGLRNTTATSALDESLDALIARGRQHLAGYQNAAWAQRFEARVRAVRQRDVIRRRWRPELAGHAQRGAQPAQAHELQGRVRGRPPLQRRQLPRGSRSSSKATSSSNSAWPRLSCRGRRTDSRPSRFRLGAWMKPAMKWPRPRQAPARHSLRCVRPHGGTSAGALADHAVRCAA